MTANRVSRREVMDGGCTFRDKRLFDSAALQGPAQAILYRGSYRHSIVPFTNAIELFPAIECLHSMRRSGIAKDCIFGRAEDGRGGTERGTSTGDQPATVS